MKSDGSPGCMGDAKMESDGSPGCLDDAKATSDGSPGKSAGKSEKSARLGEVGWHSRPGRWHSSPQEVPEVPGSRLALKAAAFYLKSSGTQEPGTQVPRAEIDAFRFVMVPDLNLRFPEIQRAGGYFHNKGDHRWRRLRYLGSSGTGVPKTL